MMLIAWPYVPGPYLKLSDRGRSEGRGLSPELLALCQGEVIIPMEPCAESLNAAVAASIILWEMRR